MTISNASYIEANEVLEYLAANDKIDLHSVAKDMEKQKKEKLIQGKHLFAITKGKDGRWRTYVEDKTKQDKRRQIAKKSRDDLIDALYQYYTGEDPVKKYDTMRSILSAWLDYKALHVANVTVDRVMRDWRRYYEGSEIVDRPLTQITKVELDEWIHKMIYRYDMNKHQYSNFISIIRQELDYAVDCGLIQQNPYDKVKVNTRRVLRREHKGADCTQVYNEEELKQFKEVAWNDFKNKRHKKHQLAPLAALFMFYTGVRVSEVCALRYEDINGDNIVVRRMLRYPVNTIIQNTKGSYGDRSVPLIRQSAEIIKAAKGRQIAEGVPQNGYIFSMNEWPLPYTSVTKFFYMCCNEIGIQPKSSHKARKTFVSSLIDANVNINTIRQIVGHVDEKTTLNNYCFDRSTDDEKQKSVENALKNL